MRERGHNRLGSYVALIATVLALGFAWTCVFGSIPFSTAPSLALAKDSPNEEESDSNAQPAGTSKQADDQEAPTKAMSDDDLLQELEVFTNVLAVVQRDYVQEVPSKKLVEGAIKGMLAALDPHSGYLDHDFYQDLQSQTKGEFGGLGIEITIRDGALVVVAPMEGSPAEKAGIKAGDLIVKIAGEYTKQFSLVDAVKRLRGPRGTEIVLSVLRKGVNDLLDVSVKRDNITVRSVRGRALGDGFGYARISQFVEKTTDDLKALLEKLKHERSDDALKGLVLDLRNNPGGLLSQAVGVGDLFLDDGIIVYTDGRLPNQRQKFYAHPRGTEPHYPIIVLVNGGSASASEIVAGSLKDHGRALILGTPTFGKGSVQTITPLENGGALTLTTALYYTKSGRSLQALGVAPDIVMDVSPAPEADKPKPPANSNEDAGEGDMIREGDLPGAIKNPNGSAPASKHNAAPAPTVPVPEPINYERDDIATLFKRDPQLERAVSILRSYNIFQNG